MRDKNIRFGFEQTFSVEKLVTIFYMEFSKDFYYGACLYRQGGDALYRGKEQLYTKKRRDCIP